MHIGLIGLGSIGMRHTRNLQELYPKAHIDVLTKRTSWEEAGPRTHLINSKKEFFAHKHDVYFITNETNLHTKTVWECLAQKPKGIFVEKPLSHDVRGLEEIHKEVRKQKIVFVVGYSMQYFKPLMEIKKLIARGEVGTVRSMRISVGQDLRGWRKSDYRDGYAADPKRGGGVILDLIHELNYPGWILGEELKVVAGVAGKISDLEIRTEDTAEATLVSKKGVVVSVHQDYLQVPGRRSCEVFGTKGTLLWGWMLNEPDAEHVIEVYGKKGVKRVRVREARGEMFKREVREFFAHVRKGDRFTNCSEAIVDMHNATALKKNWL